MNNEKVNYNGYSSNVGLIKFIAAAMVIVSHSYSLSTGSNINEPFVVFSHGQTTMGRIAVWIFFFYSGLLITKSLLKNNDGKRFFKKRLLRLIPPLFTVVAVCIFILGPIVTELSLRQYFGNLNTWKYLLNSIFILIHNLPGVFKNNILDSTVNGALWTLPVEMCCYIMCFIMFKLKFLEPLKMKILFVIALISVIFLPSVLLSFNLDVILSAMLAMLSFFAGMCFYIFREKIPMKLSWMVIAILFIIISNVFGCLFIGMFIGLSYLLAYLGFAAKRVPNKLGSLGNYSYAMYLCGVPIQQTLVHFFGGSMNSYLNLSLALILDIIFAFLIYEFVENKFDANFK